MADGTGRSTHSVVIVTGTVMAKPETIDEMLALSLEHVHRSRGESGCLAHAVHRDAEDAMRLVFLEEWADLDALRAHFAVPASGAFVEAMTALAASPPAMRIYRAEAARP